MSAVAGPSTKRVHVTYCQVCSLPIEYCEFGSSLSKCKIWLEEQDPDAFARLYSDDALKEKIGTLSLDKQEKLEAEAEKAEKKAEKKAETEKKKKAAAKITIKRESRNKRKHITSIHGLDAFGVDLKKAAKFLAQKFATGASVTRNPQGFDEIVIQGDVTEEVIDLITDQAGPLQGAPADQIIKVEAKAKGAAAAA
ncbi:Translation machinery-associated protein 22 [Naganishia adeliensis]|uniref:Translation machinery-associated protein 22 n=1 Tax=Naganishia adeliensis TaxID=92952 RepID=A0ACC2W614_9TREE|nr:Translation machinery-associated protein 22 [Naganishia adeliensis]